MVDQNNPENKNQVLSMVLNHRYIYIHNMDNPDNPLELVFQEEYGNIVSYEWYNENHILFGFSNGNFVVMSMGIYLHLHLFYITFKMLYKILIFNIYMNVPIILSYVYILFYTYFILLNQIIIIKIQIILVKNYTIKNHIMIILVI